MACRRQRLWLGPQPRLVNTQAIAPHVPVIDKSKRKDGTFSRADFIYDEARDIYTCPAGQTLTTTGRLVIASVAH
jgi:hypothetical protein